MIVNMSNENNIANNKNDDLDMVVFFGSGADTDYCPGLKSGADFNEALINSKYNEQIKALIGKKYSYYSILHQNSVDVYLQTIYEKTDEANKVFKEEKVNKICSYYETKHKIKDIENDEKNKEETVDNNDDSGADNIKDVCKIFYNILNNKDLNEKYENIKDICKESCKEFCNDCDSDSCEYRDKDEITQMRCRIKKFFLSNLIFFDSLDEKFNSLRYVGENKIASNTKRIKKVYFTVYFTILDWLYDFVKDFKGEQNGFDKLYKEVRKDITKKFAVSDKSYYKVLSNSGLNYQIVTTNYTNLAEKHGKKNDSCNETIYLHGKLTWFEDLKNLTVYDCADEDELKKLKKVDKKHIIPFILIPSGVKPLICQKQIECFHQFIEALSKTKILLVVGYKFNSEDNHVNSLIAEWLRKDVDNKMIYLNFNEEVDFKNMAWSDMLSKKDEKINEKKMIMDDILNKNDKEQIVNLIIDENNARTTFEEVLNNIKA